MCKDAAADGARINGKRTEGKNVFVKSIDVEYGEGEPGADIPPGTLASILKQAGLK
ncbi:MAG: hypothetical protein ACE5GV_08545 [Candidatus Scalindua sp.]